MGGITIVFVLYNHNAIIVHIKVMVVGGLTNNILAPQYVEKQHAEKVILYFFLSANVDSAISASVCSVAI